MRLRFIAIVLRAACMLMLVLVGCSGDHAVPTMALDMAQPCAGGLWTPYGITLGADRVYWTDSTESGGAVWQVTRGGGVPTMLAKLPGRSFPRGLALHDGDIFASGHADGLWRVPLDGSAPTLVAQIGGPHGVAAASDAAYFAGDGSLDEVWKVPFAGGAPIPIAPSPWKANGMFGCGGAIAVSATDVYWTDWCERTLRKVPLDGGTVSLVDSDPAGDVRDVLTVDDENVYWVTRTQVKQQPLGGGDTAVIAAIDGSLFVGGLAVDNGYVYWSTAPNIVPTQPGVISRAPIGGGDVTTVAAVPFAGALALDATSIYSVEGGNCVAVTPR